MLRASSSSSATRSDTVQRAQASQPSDDLMQITGPAVYEKFTITSKDNNKEVDD